MSELARECHSERNLDTIVRTQQSSDQEPTTEAVIRAAEENNEVAAKTLPAFEDMNNVLRQLRIDWNSKFQDLGYKSVDDKTVALGDMLVVAGRELPIIIESDPQRDFVEYNYDNLTDKPMAHWRKSK